MNPAWTEDEGLLAVAAFRYSCGRMTYMPDVCAGWLIRHWHEFPQRVRTIVQRDLEEEFKRDDEARAEGREYKPLGHDCDRKTWERVRALWAP
ncbi:hypothetical protein [Pseudorhodoferax sp. Leaf265]|uniref:hypothetical protein n=1 Tax=Pseudorhodoferax sp. Leaf265 TaxID=1736315 RepID=UPI0006F99C7A|nr:hypothetical protein [Pseudorhodoferax sp. Leaf265]KQP02509.1 hypothetical protein ASF45_20870 [Pseudorhodoferax sp. Leaf265]